MLETERHARLEKGESLFRHFVSFLVIGVYSEINNITGISSHLEIESFWSPLVASDYGALILVH